MSKKRTKEKVELFLDTEKDKDVIEYMEQNATTKAGFIRQVLKDYVQARNSGAMYQLPQQPIQKNAQASTSSKEDEIAENEEPQELTTEEKQTKKEKAKRETPPKKTSLSFGQSFSASDLLKDDGDEEN